MLGGYSFVRKRAFIPALRIEDDQKASRRSGIGGSLVVIRWDASYLNTIGIIKMATIFATLIMGLMAGPEVSL